MVFFSSWAMIGLKQYLINLDRKGQCVLFTRGAGILYVEGFAGDLDLTTEYFFIVCLFGFLFVFFVLGLVLNFVFMKKRTKFWHFFFLGFTVPFFFLLLNLLTKVLYTTFFFLGKTKTSFLFLLKKVILLLTSFRIPLGEWKSFFVNNLYSQSNVTPLKECDPQIISNFFNELFSLIKSLPRFEKEEIIQQISKHGELPADSSIRCSHLFEWLLGPYQVSVQDIIQGRSFFIKSISELPMREIDAVLLNYCQDLGKMFHLFYQQTFPVLFGVFSFIDMVFYGFFFFFLLFLFKYNLQFSWLQIFSVFWGRVVSFFQQKQIGRFFLFFFYFVVLYPIVLILLYLVFVKLLLFMSLRFYFLFKLGTFFFLFLGVSGFKLSALLSLVFFFLQIFLFSHSFHFIYFVVGLHSLLASVFCCINIWMLSKKKKKD